MARVRSQPLAVTLFSKPGCHLCDVAADALRRLDIDLPLDITIVDITTDPSIYELYRYRIPVVTSSNGIIAEGKVTEFRLRQVLDLL